MAFHCRTCLHSQNLSFPSARPVHLLPYRTGIFNAACPWDLSRSMTFSVGFIWSLWRLWRLWRLTFPYLPGPRGLDLMCSMCRVEGELYQ